MKSLLTLVIAISIFSTNLVAQSEDANPERKPAKEVTLTDKYVANTLAKNGGRPSGGFFAPSFKISEVNGQNATLAGAQLAIVLGHQVNVGLAGYALLSNVTTNYIDNQGQQTFLELGYGGIFIEPVFFDKSIFHITTPIFFGAGGATLYQDRIWDDNYDYYYSDYTADAFFVGEPGVNLEINIARVLRFGIGTSYRVVFNSDLPTLDDNKLSGWNANFTMKFGWF
jgi:hypothetical protein